MHWHYLRQGILLAVSTYVIVGLSWISHILYCAKAFILAFECRCEAKTKVNIWLTPRELQYLRKKQPLVPAPLLRVQDIPKWITFSPSPSASSDIPIARVDGSIDDREYEIQDYLDVAVVAGATFVRVQWKGFSRASATWENTLGAIYGVDVHHREEKILELQQRPQPRLLKKQKVAHHVPRLVNASFECVLCTWYCLSRFFDYSCIVVLHHHVYFICCT